MDEAKRVLDGDEARWLALNSELEDLTETVLSRRAGIKLGETLITLQSKLAVVDLELE